MAHGAVVERGRARLGAVDGVAQDPAARLAQRWQAADAAHGAAAAHGYRADEHPVALAEMLHRRARLLHLSHAAACVMNALWRPDLRAHGHDEGSEHAPALWQGGHILAWQVKAPVLLGAAELMSGCLPGRFDAHLRRALRPHRLQADPV